MSRQAAADAYLHLHRREVEFIVKDRKGVHVELVEAQRLLNRVTAVVHECLRFEEQHALAADAAFADQAPELLRPWTEAVRLRDHVGAHEADVVALHRIFGARIAEPDPELHGAALACGPGKKKPPAG